MPLIRELYTATPTYITLESNEKDIDEQELSDEIVNNLEKKYNMIFNESIKADRFIEFISKENRKPIAMKYKSTTLIGNKYKLLIGRDINSQKLAYIALSTGLLEKSSALGFGFIIGRKV